jgi:hypothetical protein
MSSTVLMKACVGGLVLSLRESRGPRYTLVYWTITNPVFAVITALGKDRDYACRVFKSRVDWIVNANWDQEED